MKDNYPYIPHQSLLPGVQEDMPFCPIPIAPPLALPLHQPSKPQTTFNAAEDLEALGSKPVGHDEEDDNKGGIEEAVAVWGFPLHVSMPNAQPPFPWFPSPLVPWGARLFQVNFELSSMRMSQAPQTNYINCSSPTHGACLKITGWPGGNLVG